MKIHSCYVDPESVDSERLTWITSLLVWRKLKMQARILLLPDVCSTSLYLAALLKKTSLTLHREVHLRLPTARRYFSTLQFWTTLAKGPNHLKHQLQDKCKRCKISFLAWFGKLCKSPRRGGGKGKPACCWCMFTPTMFVRVVLREAIFCHMNLVWDCTTSSFQQASWQHPFLPSFVQMVNVALLLLLVVQSSGVQARWLLLWLAYPLADSCLPLLLWQCPSPDSFPRWIILNIIHLLIYLKSIWKLGGRQGKYDEEWQKNRLHEIALLLPWDICTKNAILTKPNLSVSTASTTKAARGLWPKDSQHFTSWSYACKWRGLEKCDNLWTNLGNNIRQGAEQSMHSLFCQIFAMNDWMNAADEVMYFPFRFQISHRFRWETFSAGGLW